MTGGARSTWAYLAIAGVGLLAGAPAPPPDDAKVDLTGAGLLKSALVIASGGDNGGCYDHIARAGVGVVGLGRDANAYWCGHEVVVQAQDHGMLLDTLPVWISGILRADLPPRVQVNLNLWVPAGDPWLAQQALIQVELADTLFNRNRAGISLTVPGSAAQAYSDSDASTVGTGCTAVDNLIRSQPPYRLFQPGSINVYYVPSISGGGTYGPMGFNCFEWGAPNVIYMSRAALDNVLAHELGHALSLQYRNGHVNGLEGFTDRNLMNALQLPSVAVLQDHWTAGQVYRMNADARSVLNSLAGIGDTAKAFRAGIKRVCQDDPKGPSPCPPLAFEESP